MKKKFNRALVSTSNKEGLIDLLRPLGESGCEIVSTGGTAEFLRKNKIPVTEVSEVTGFPEVMDGRVRTLHPKIHMGLLARSYVPEDMDLLSKQGVIPFDLVVVNLYPFAEAVEKNLKGHELIEQIDIGGPSLLRAAAKSFERITVLCEPEDYNLASEAAEKIELRQELAAKVFSHCSLYDAFVAQNLLPEGRGQLRYGENPHQKGFFYKNGKHPLSLHNAKQKQGKELSYNNILDLEAAVGLVCEFDQPATTIVKHNSPCGVAVDSNITVAYEKAFAADSVSAFGGIVAINRPVSRALAEKLAMPFLECIIAPSFDDNALSVLSLKKNLRLLELSSLGKSLKLGHELEQKSVRGGVLVQTVDGVIGQWDSEWKILGDHLIEPIKQDLLFALKVVKHVKSNAIVIASNLQTLGICGGQTNRIDSVKMALNRSKTDKLKVMASDAFFPFRDSVDLAAQSGVKWIIQPGGSLRDKEVEQAAKDHGIGMVITGRRHFKH